MSRKQLAALFICCLLPYSMSNGLLSLLPIYVRRFDVSATSTGFYLALTFASLAAGSLLSGTLSRRFRQHKPFVLLSIVIGGLAVFLMGQAPNMPLLALFTFIAWFTGGIQLTMVQIVTGLSADKKRRGRVFGIIGIAPVLGAVLGGATAGPITDHLGFEALFTANAASYLIALLAVLGLEDKTPPQTVAKSTEPARLNKPLLLLITAGILMSVANFTTGLVRPLTMNALNFDSTAITSTIAVANALNLPMPFLMGWLSDRFSRKQILIACYGFVAVGVVILGPAALLWHFWLSQTLVVVNRSERAISSAFAADLVPPRLLNTGMSRLSTAPWIGAVIGYGTGGVILQLLGSTATLLLAALLPLVAMGLVYAIRPNSHEAVTIETQRLAHPSINRARV